MSLADEFIVRVEVSGDTSNMDQFCADLSKIHFGHPGMVFVSSLSQPAVSRIDPKFTSPLNLIETFNLVDQYFPDAGLEIKADPPDLLANEADLRLPGLRLIIKN